MSVNIPARRALPHVSADPVGWSPYDSDAMAVGVDYGFAHDHSAVAVAGLWNAAGGAPLIGVPYVRRLALRTPVHQVIAEIHEAQRQFLTCRGPRIVVVDSRSNAPFFHAVLHEGIPAIGASLTAAERHATRPQVFPVSMPGGARPIPAAEYTLSRNQLIEELIALTASQSGQGLYITQRGDSAVLFEEMQSLRRETTEARNIRYVTAPGAHDDLLVALGMAVWAISNLATVGAMANRLAATSRQGSPKRYAPEPSPLGWA
jgi:hypothetical protein